MNSFFGGHISWVDYTNDGHLDLSLTGFQISDYFGGRGTGFYKWANGVYVQDLESEINLDMNNDGVPEFWVNGGVNGHHWGDYDNDGDLDVFVVNHADVPQLYQNEGGNYYDWIRIKVVESNGKTQSKESVSVKIPKGVDDGTRIRVSGKGEAGSKGGSTGDLYLFISVDNHSIFKRSDEHLYFELPITFTDAALGTSVEVPSIDGGKAKIKIPSGTQHGKQLRLRGKGMPLLRGNGYGDLYIKIITEVPSNLNSKQKELLEEFRKIESEKSSPIIKSFFEKAKKFWKNS